MDDEQFDPSQLTALVVDTNHYQRSIACDQLRAMGFKRATGVSDAIEGWDALSKVNPDIILLEWFEGALEFVRKVRMSEETPNRAVSIFMLTTRGAKAEVESARKAGVDGYLRKPISALALQKRVRAVVLNPQPFIVTATYVGPCRRRRQDPTYAGPWRRLGDQIPETQPSEDDVDLRAEMARAAVAALDAEARTFESGDARAARRVFKAAQDLCTVCDSIDDAILKFGAAEMIRYLQAQGATSRLDPEVVRTHIAALHQLAMLPAAMRAERDGVAQSLKRMVDKKLRQAG